MHTQLFMIFYFAKKCLNFLVAGESKLSNGAPAFEACSSPRRSLNPTGGDTHSNSENGDFEVVYVVPDGGWGWMVLFGSILVNILIPGTVKSFGILFVEFLEVFDASPAAAAWIPALSYWLYSSMGKCDFCCNQINFLNEFLY